MIAISYDASRAKVSVMFGPTLYYVRLSCIDYIQYSERYSKQVKYLTILCIRCYVIETHLSMTIGSEICYLI